MTRLAINVDHIATIREARGTIEPNPVIAAIDAERAGAHGIVMHLRMDRRHIQLRDLELAAELIRVPLNLEMAVHDKMLEIAARVKPAIVTLVPENPEEISTEGGLDLKKNPTKIFDAINQLKDSIQEISLFIDPEESQVISAIELGADGIELHTGKYAELQDGTEKDHELNQIRVCAEMAKNAGLNVRAGHGITYLNVTPIAAITVIDELSIGHSIIARSVFRGLFAAVQDMLVLIN